MRKINKKLKEFVIDQCRKAAWNIGVSHYEIDIFYMEEKKKGEEGQVLGEMTTDRRYLKGNLKLYPQVEEMWEDGDKKGVAGVVHHEIAHLATQHLYDCGTATYVEEGEMKDSWESLTTIIGRMSMELDKYKNK